MPSAGLNCTPENENTDPFKGKTAQLTSREHWCVFAVPKKKVNSINININRNIDPISVIKEFDKGETTNLHIKGASVNLCK